MLEYAKKREATSPETSPARLFILANSANEEVRFFVASNPSTPTSALFDLAVEFPGQVLQNPIFPLLILESPDFLATIPPKALLSFLCAQEVPVDLIETAIHHPKRDVRIFLTQHKKTPEHLLACFAQDKSPDVREALLRNANAPLRLLLPLLGDDSEDVRKKAARDNRVIRSGAPYYLRRLAQRPTDGDFLIEEELAILLMCGPSVRLQVANYPRLSTKLLTMLVEAPEPGVRFAVASHPQTSNALLKKLSQDLNEAVRVCASKRLG